MIIRNSFEVPRSRVLRASSTQSTSFSRVRVSKEMASAVTGGGGGTAQKRRDSTVTREGDQLVITPLGAGNEVGRSCVHMTYRGKTILVNLLIWFPFEALIRFGWFKWGDLPTVWLRDSSGLLGDGCIAILRWDRSFNCRCATHHSVCIQSHIFPFCLVV